LDFLLAHPQKKRAVYNSFAGLRRFNAFIDHEQLDFSICFSLKDRDANYSLDKFVARVVELRGSPRSSLASFKNQAQAGLGWIPVFIVNTILILASVASRSYTIPFAACIALLILLNIAVAIFFVRYRRYMARLHKKLLAMKPDNSFKSKPLRGPG
jgi:hypothetical protein